MKRKGDEDMSVKYNKLFQYEGKGIYRPHVTVTGDLKVETGMMPKELIPLLASELSKPVWENPYTRTNPYKINNEIDRHVYIQYAEPRKKDYEIITKKIVQNSLKGNFKIPKETFLFDLLDYFIEIKLLDNNYKFIGKLPKREYRLIDVYSEEYLRENGFIFQ